MSTKNPFSSTTPSFLTAKKNPFSTSASNPFSTSSASNPFSASSGGSTDLEKLMRQVSSNSAKVLSVGGTLPNSASKPSVLERILGPLQASLAGVNAIVHNVTTDGKDENVLGQMGNAASGKDYITGSDLLKDWGWNPQTSIGKFARGVVGFAWDIGADPVTYFTAGLNKVTKLAGMAKAANVARDGFETAKAVDYGIDLSKYADAIGDAATKIMPGVLNPTDKTKLFYGIMRDVSIAEKDAGGIKFFGKSLVSGDALGKMVPESVKTIIDKAALTKPAMTLGRVFSHDFYEVKHAADPFTAVTMTNFWRDSMNQASKGFHEGIEVAKDIKGNLPEEAANALGIAMDSAIPVEKRAHAAELFDEMKKLEKVLDGGASDSAVAAARERLSAVQKEATDIVHNVMDWDKFGISLKAFDPSMSDEAIVQATDSAKSILSNSERVLKQYHDAGIPVKDLGEFHAFPRQAGAPDQSILSALDMDKPSLVDRLLPPDRTLASTNNGALSSTDALGKRSFDTFGEALQGGQKYTTYAPEAVAKQNIDAVNAIAANDFKRKLGDSLGKVVKEGEELAKGKSTFKIANGTTYAVDDVVAKQLESLTKPLTSDAGIKGVLDGVNKLTSIWRKWATVMNPGFVPRNGISNFYLAYTKGYANPVYWEKTLKLNTALQNGTVDREGIWDVVRGKTWTNGDFLDAAEANGGINLGEMEEVFHDSAVRSLSRKANPVTGLQKVGTKANSFTERWGRMAVFAQALKKTGSPEIAGRMADVTLYNYNPASLTNAEKGLRTLIPFYTWTRSNLPEMLRVLVQDPSKISTIGKLQSNMADVSDKVNKDLLPQYQRDMIPIPTPFKDKDGNTLQLNPNFGFQDINKIDQPLSDTLASLNPFFKVPLELYFNRDSYFKSDIQDYPGQLKKAPGYLQSLDKAFNTQPWWELIKKGAGAKTIDGYLKASPQFVKTLDMWPFLANLGKALQTDNAETPWRRLSWLGGLKLMPYQEDKFKTDYLYKQRDDLMDTIQKLKDQGVIKSGTNQ